MSSVLENLSPINPYLYSPVVQPKPEPQKIVSDRVLATVYARVVVTTITTSKAQDHLLSKL